MILALETATAACSVALLDDGGGLVAERVNAEGPAHTQHLLPGVHAVLSESGVTIGGVDCVVVGLGPGAYTGMRIGIATARALAQAAGVVPARLAGVPTLAALALALAAAHQEASVFAPLIDGRRSEVFAGIFGRSNGSVRALDEHLAVVPGTEIGDFLAAWPGAVAGGDGARLYAAGLPATVRLSPVVAGPTAAHVGRAFIAGVPGIVEGLARVLPLYGREPDAVRWHTGSRT